MYDMARTQTVARVSLSPGEALAPALVRTARARGSRRLHFRTTSGRFDWAVLGFEDLRMNAYRSAELSPATVVCLDGEIDVSGDDAHARIAAVLQDGSGTRHSGRLLEARVGHPLDIFVVDPSADGDLARTTRASGRTAA